MVLFKDAMEHICRISRIIDRSSGHALLVGVGGSGKQSLTKLAVFLLSAQLDTIVVTSTFSVNDFKASIGEMFKKATKPPGTQRAFMLNDSQLSNENFFIYLNDILNSGYVPNLWPKEELDSVCMGLKNEAKIAGYTDKPEDLFTYFVDKVKKNCSVILCMSPVGDNLRVKARKFPGLVNSSSINYFHSWPEDALFNVATNFLRSIELPEDMPDLNQNICQNMADTHMSISEANRRFRVQVKRYNYTTPKSFLELIEFYKNLLNKNRSAIQAQIDVYANGLDIIAKTSAQVGDLRVELEKIMIDVEAKTKSTNILIEEVERESAIANTEQEIANKEQEKVSVLVNNANKIKADAEEKFLAAKPKLEAAEAALERLNEKDITIFKGFKSPPSMCFMTGKVLLYIYKGEKVDFFSEKDNADCWKKTLSV